MDPPGSEGSFRMTKRNIVINDDLWMEIHRETGRVTLGTGRPLSASEWIRETIRAELERLRQLRGVTP
jgi:hypothetical protein